MALNDLKTKPNLFLVRSGGVCSLLLIFSSRLYRQMRRDFGALIFVNLVGFYGISTIIGYLMANPTYTHISNMCFGWVLWHINHWRLFNAKSYLHTFIRYMCSGWGLWHINHCRLFNAKSYLHRYIKYMCFAWGLWHINHCRLFNAEFSL